MVTDVKRLIDMLEKTFNAEPLRMYERPDGTILHAEVRIDDSVIMMSEGNAGYDPYSLWLHIYVPDVDAVYQKALDVGFEGLLAPVVKEGDPDKRGNLKDFSGNFWSVSTQVESED